MLGILDGLEWHEKAIAFAENSPDPKAQGWMGSLLNNLGWTYYDKGEYAKALQVGGRSCRVQEGGAEMPAVGDMDLQPAGLHDGGLFSRRSLGHDGQIADEFAATSEIAGDDQARQFGPGAAERFRGVLQKGRGAVHVKPALAAPRKKRLVEWGQAASAIGCSWTLKPSFLRCATSRLALTSTGLRSKWALPRSWCSVPCLRM